MAGYKFVQWIAVTIVVICIVHGNDDMVSVINRIDNLNKQMFDVKRDLADVGETVTDQIDTAKTSLRSELKQDISEYVREAIEEILQGESIEEMVRSQVLTEVRQLRRGNHQMKRQLHRVLMSLGDVQKEMNTYKETIKKSPIQTGQSQICSKCLLDNELLKRDFGECKRTIDELTVQKERDIIEMKQNFAKLNQTYQLKLMELSTTMTTTQTVTPSSTSKTTTLETTLPTSTAQPEEQRSRIIIAPMWSYTSHQFRQLNIDTNTVSTYQLRSLKHIISTAYISQLNKLLIGFRKPNKIVSSNLDSNNIVTVRENVRTYGMAVDEERQIVFLTTNVPRYTISRMTTQGELFTDIVDLSAYRYGRAIAVNAKQKKIFICNSNNVLTVSYDGRGLQTLATGTYMFALTLDNTGNILYFNDKEKLMKLSLPRNVTTTVTTLSVTPYTMRYFRDTVYYSSFDASSGPIGAVDIGDIIVSKILQPVTMNGAATLAICLVP